MQFAVARSATVIGTASAGDHEHLRLLGAVPVVYGDGLVDRVRASAPAGVYAVLDAARRGALPESVALCRGTFQIVTIADPAAFAMGIPVSGEVQLGAGDLARVAQDATDGRLRVVVSHRYALEDAAAAHSAVESSHAHGKSMLLLT